MNNSRRTDQQSHRLQDNPQPPSASIDTHSFGNIGELSGINFYALFESVSDAVFLLDGEIIVDCNTKTLEMFACNREQIINQSLEKYFPPRQLDGSDSQEKIKQIIDNVLGGESGIFAGELVRANNIHFQAEINFQCIDLKGKRFSQCIMRHVTDCEGEKEFYKTMAISSLIGIYVLRDGKFIFVNQKFQEYVGYSASELIGMKSIEIVHPEDRASVRENAIRMLKMQRTNPYEFRTITKNGRMKWTLETVNPIFHDGQREVLGNYVDISDQKRSEEVLKASEERYRGILENIEDGYYEVNLKGAFTFFNQSFCRMLGFSGEELRGTQFRRYVDKDTAKKMSDIVGKVYQTGQPEKCSDFEVTRKDGFKRQIETSLSLVKDLSGKPIGFRGVARDIDDRKKADATIYHMAYHDVLTGLPNRLLFNDHLNVAMSLAQRNNKNFAVMMLDLDKFKHINDSLGHDIGDLLLQSVSNRLRGRLRKSDTIARMGGDEFMLLLPEIGRQRDAEVIARKIVDSFERAFVIKSHELRITASIGIAIYPDGGTDFDSLKKNADIAMYKAKENGRNNYQCYNFKMAQKSLFEQLSSGNNNSEQQ